MKIKRWISLFLAVVLCTSLIPSSVFAATVTPVITVKDSYGKAGATVNVDVSIKDNPGILGMTLKLNFDEKILRLIEIKNGSALSAMSFTSPQGEALKSGCMLPWDAESVSNQDIQDGTVATLTFQIAETAQPDELVKIELICVDALDKDANPMTIEMVAGQLQVLTYTPGDVNDDGKITTTDVAALRRYIAGGYNVTIQESAGDVNDDGKYTTTDVVFIRRYIAGGYGVELKPVTPKCIHTMQAIAAQNATCTDEGNNAYWYCNKCTKYFSDAAGSSEIDISDTVIKALGHLPGAEPTCTEAQTCTRCNAVLKVANNHTEVVVPGYEATPEKEGLTDGIKCSVCGKWVVEQTVIEKPQPQEHSITYFISAGDYIDQGDAYLQKQVIENPNPTTYKESEMVILKPLASPGYTFDGWVDQHGTRWDVIPKGTTQELVLYAKWTQNIYTVTFDTPDVDVTYTTNKGEKLMNKAEYTIDTGLTLKNPTAYKYTFVGWSNDEGFIVNEIKPGTAKNMTLRANWTSDRNRATSYSNYGEPIIIEDNERKQFLFIYNIGKIDNVPLYTYKRENGEKIMYQNTTVDFVDTTTLKTEFTKEDAQNIAKTVANATTRSSGWTLSEGWNNVMSESQEDATKQVHSEERIDSKGNVIGNAYFVSNSEGGSSYSSVESGSTSSSSARVTTEDSFGINTSYDKSTEKYCDAELSTGFKNETELSAGISAPVGIAKVEAGVKNTTTITSDAKVSSGRKDNEAFHVDTNSSSFVGTDFSSSSSAYCNAVTSNSTNWNSTNSYEKSEQMSQETSVAQAIANEIESTTTYNISKALNGAETNTASVSGVTSDETGYSNSVTVSEYFSKENVHVESHKDDHVGNHRLVEAGIVHVYGVVGYDIATASYYTYTFNVLEDDTYAYWDYSLKDPSFKDCENGLVTFEIPYEVNEYISGVTGKTEGLEIEIDNEGYGCVTGFDVAENFTGDVIVPQYLGVDNLDDTQDPVVVTSFDASAFRGKTEIKTVILPMYVTEIPAYAFEGCTNLETVIAYGVTKIGDYAFKGCVNLGKFVNSKGETEYSAFMVDNMVTLLGEGAFEGVNEIKVMAYDAAVADAAIHSGAKKITLDLTKLKDTYSGTKKITNTTKFFKIIGGGKTFSGLSIYSDAKESFVSNMTFTENTDIPLEFSSETVTLARVTVENAPGLALALKAENTALKLYRDVKLTSNSDNSVLSKNVTLSKANTGISGTLDFSGKYLVCGEITNTSMLRNPENVKKITQDEYNKYRTAVTVKFNANGGSNIAAVTVGYATKITAPANPKKDHYSFLGWYTDEALTSAFNFDTPVTSNMTLYAKWKLNEFTVSFDANGGKTSTTSKEVIYGEPYGTLPTADRTGYTFSGWYTAKTGGSKVTKDTIMTAAANHTLYAQWKVLEYTVGWNTGTGYTITVKRTSSPYAGAATGTLNSGNKVYYGDVLAVTYTKHDYYTIKTHGATSITVTGNVTASNIYATAELNPLKGWTKASEVPSGAKIENRKWSYTKTTTTESKETSLAGYTQTGSYWVESGRGSVNYATFPSGFDTSHSIYKNFAKSALTGYENATTKRVVTDSKGGYVYWHWMYDVGYANTTTRTISHRKGSWDADGSSGGNNFKYFYALASTVDCKYLDTYYCCSQGLPSYYCHDILPSDKTHIGTPRFFRFTYRVSSYVDYYKMFQYKKVENLESSTPITASGSISNVQEWVLYREK